jgi:hypothetical protein
MMIAWKRPSIMFALVITLMTLLPLLAFLQYRWLGRISEAEHEKMLESLKRDVEQFCKELDREVTIASLVFSVKAGSTSEEKAQEYQLSYRRWLGVSKHPAMVKAAYDVDGDWSLSLVDPASGTLQPREWPAELLRARTRLEKITASGGLSRQVILTDPANAGSDAPALVVPKTAPMAAKNIPKFSGGGSGAGDSSTADKQAWSDMLPSLKSALTGTKPAQSHGFTMVVFDEGYLTGNFIPGLVEKYFGANPKSAYTVTVVQAGSSENTLYQSDAARQDTDPASGDVVDGMFAVRLDELAGVVVDRMPQLSGLANKTIGMSTQRFSSSGTAAPPGAASQVAAVGVWKVVVRHKAGSLDAAVASTRRTNLAISFGILVVLGAAVALTLVSTYRARKLARQQVEFVAGVSHEFRTPLSVICSAGENLADGVIETDAHVKRYGKLIESEGKRLTEMMEQVLEFAGVQSGSRAIVPRPISPVEVIERWPRTACHSSRGSSRSKGK